MANSIYSYDVTIPRTLDPKPTNSAQPRESIVRVARLIGRVAAGLESRIPGGVCQVQCKEAAVAASGTVTLATALANDTATIGGVVFTAVAGASAGDQFSIDGSNTVNAADFVTRFNASATAGITGITASSVAGVVTFQADDPGLSGNGITLASSNGTRLAVSGARLSGGTATYTTLAFS